MKISDGSLPPAAVGRRDFLKLGAGAGAAAMTVLNASSALAQGGRDDQPGCTDCRAIDLHAHWEPEPYIKAMAEYGRDIRPDPRSDHLDQRLKWMDDHGVQIHVLTLNSPPWRFLEPRVGARVAAIANDAAMEAHRQHPTRFYGGIVMPIEDPQLALKELNRCAGQPGMRAVHLINSHLGEEYLFKPDFEPVFARVEELGYPLLFHPVNEGVIGEDRLQPPESFLTNTIGYPMEHTTIAAKFIFNGTLDRHPKLQILMSHAGGAFPYLAGRIEQGFLRRKVQLKRPFREQVRQFYFDVITFRADTLRFLIDFAGADRVVVGTDNFQFMDIEPTWLLHQIDLSPADLEKIIRGNAAKLLGIS
jgi:aminocarboxymuconate-semialdehyde decarboxylase